MRQPPRRTQALLAAILLLTCLTHPAPAKAAPKWPDGTEAGPEPWNRWLFIPSLHLYCRKSDYEKTVNFQKHSPITLAPLYTLAQIHKDQTRVLPGGPERVMDDFRATPTSYKIFGETSPNLVVQNPLGISRIARYYSIGDWVFVSFFNRRESRSGYCRKDECLKDGSSLGIGLFDLYDRKQSANSNIVTYHKSGDKLFRGTMGDPFVLSAAFSRVKIIKQVLNERHDYVYIYPPGSNSERAIPRSNPPGNSPHSSSKKPAKKTASKKGAKTDTISPHTEGGGNKKIPSPSSPAAPVALSAVEKGWLTRDQLAKHPAAKTARNWVAAYLKKNLSKEAAANYLTAVRSGKSAEIDAYLDGLIKLADDEYQSLPDAEKPKYTTEMKPLKPNPKDGGRVPLTNRGKAYKIVQKYRVKVSPKKSGGPQVMTQTTKPTSPAVYDPKRVDKLMNDPKTGLKRGKDLLTTKDWNDLWTAWTAVTDPKTGSHNMTMINDLYARYNPKIVNLESCDPQPKDVKTLPHFDQLWKQDNSCKEKFCKDFLPNFQPKTASTVKTIQGAYNEAVTANKSGDLALSVLHGQLKTSSVASPASNEKPDDAAKTYKAMNDKCGPFVASLDEPAWKASKKGDNPPPWSGKGSDTGNDKKPDEENKHLYRDIANGTTFGLFGMVLGSFFGGPVTMLAFAVVAGGGAYALSSYLNSPKPPDKPSGGGGGGDPEDSAGSDG